MKAHRLIAAAGAASLLSACMGGGGGVNSASSSAIDAKAPETFAYAPASDRSIRVSVDQVLMQGQRGYLPKDRNWLQLQLTVTNVGRQTIQLSDVRARLNNGVVIAAAGTGHELAAAPSFGGTAAKSLGIGVAGQVAGSLIFPPLALVAGGIGLANMLGGHESWRKRLQRIEGSLLRAQAIAPGTSVTGNVYVPAVRGQTALIVFYVAGGRSQSLVVARTGATL
ncbi:hypothetical protein P1X14_03395 [Sphingomonas sp. AOB5]|uniref:hypothetical protein n=1 Tax=Sphingomonas sp. AOB5 TaxID=3034017 RepID=UPI0023FA1AD2|nr:hypothetical protein [Sphingomonas sp. AOB5]MDF7774283.1 hypothetical protein [Sphingomonas sp. AOB5]